MYGEHKSREGDAAEVGQAVGTACPPGNLREETNTNRSSKIDTKGRNNDIEILRGISIIIVIIDHILAISQAPVIIRFTNDIFSFWGGVDLFFAISGFVIGSTLLRQDGGNISFSDKIAGLAAFWIRRIWRLWPAAWFWLAAPLALGLITIPDFQSWAVRRELFASLIGGLLNVVNIQQWAFNSGSGMGNPLWGQYWSLSLEQQLYLLNAPMLLFMKRRHLISVLTLIILCQFFLNRPANSGNIWWFVRSDAFAWGVLLAVFLSNPISKAILEPSLLARKWAAWIVLTISLLGLISTQLLYSVPFQVGIMAFLSAILVYAASYDKKYLGVSGIMAKLFLWLGERSYGIYLCHGSVIVFLLHVAPYNRLDRGNLQNLIFIAAAILVVTLVLAELSYRIIELPARLYGRNLARLYQSKINMIHSKRIS